MRLEPGSLQTRTVKPACVASISFGCQTAARHLQFGGKSPGPAEEAAQNAAAVAKFQLLQAQADEKRKSLPCLLQARYPLKGKKATLKEMQAIESACQAPLISRQQEKAILSQINTLLLGLESRDWRIPQSSLGVLTPRMAEPLAQEIFHEFFYRMDTPRNAVEFKKPSAAAADFLPLAEELPEDVQKVLALRQLLGNRGMLPLHYFMLAASIRDIPTQVAMIRELVDSTGINNSFTHKRSLSKALEAIPEEAVRAAEIERYMAYENPALENRSYLLNGDDEVRQEAVKAIASLSPASEDKKIALIRAALNREDDWFLGADIGLAIASLSNRETREQFIRECLASNEQSQRRAGVTACQGPEPRDDKPADPDAGVSPELQIQGIVEGMAHHDLSSGGLRYDLSAGGLRYSLNKTIRNVAGTEAGREFIRTLHTDPSAYPDLSKKSRNMILAMALPALQEPELIAQVLPDLISEDDEEISALLTRALPDLPNTVADKTAFIRTRLQEGGDFQTFSHICQAIATLPSVEQRKFLDSLIPAPGTQSTLVQESPTRLISLHQAMVGLNDPEKYTYLTRLIARKDFPDPAYLADFILGLRHSGLLDPALWEGLLKQLDAHPNPNIQRAALEIRLHQLLQQPDQTEAEALIRKTLQQGDEESGALAAQSIADIRDPERRYTLAQELLMLRTGEHQKHALPAMAEHLWTKLSKNLAATGYYEMLKQAFPESLATPNAEKRELPAILLLSLLAMAATLEKDAGDIQKTILPQFRELLAYAKAEANNHRGVGEEEYSEESIENGFETNKAILLRGLMLLGPDVFKFKLNQGMEKFIKFLDTLPLFFPDETVMPALNRMASLPTTQPQDVARLMEVAAGFIILNQPETLLTAIRAQPVLNLKALGKVYLETFARVFGLKCEVSDQSFERWNLEYMNALSEAYRNFDPDAQQALKALVEATLADNYPAYLTNPDTEVGKANAKTADIFRENGLDHKTWLHYDKTRPFTVGKEEQASYETIFKQYLTHLSGDILALTGSWREKRPGLLEKQDTQALFGLLKHQGYRFENGLLTSDTPEKLTAPALGNLSTQIKTFLEKRGIVTNAQQQKRQDILTLVSHISQRVQDFDTLRKQVPGGVKNLSLKIWDRNPGYDLFQGNYSQCCIAVDRHNRSAIVDYLSTTLSQMVEVKDTDTGRTIANAVLFWAKNETDPETNQSNLKSTPYLVVDSVEIATQYAGAAKKIKQELIPYLKDYAKAVSGKDTPLLIGTRYNDIDTEGLTEHPMEGCQVLGTSPTGELYLDALAGNEWSDITAPIPADFKVLQA